MISLVETSIQDTQHHCLLQFLHPRKLHHLLVQCFDIAKVKEEQSRSVQIHEVFERSSQDKSSFNSENMFELIHMFRGGLLGIKYS